MALHIDNPETMRLAHLLAAATGESLIEAVHVAVRERLERVQRSAKPEQIIASVQRLQELVRELPVRDSRPPEEILGYGPDGLPS